MRVLITGSNGQVGNILAKLLTRDINNKVLALDKSALDITDKDAVINIVTKFQPEVIINAAAYTAVDKAEEEIELCYAINRDGPKYLAKAAHAIGAKILHISTDYVFDGNKGNEYLESDIANPQGVYGQSKLAGEIAVAEACDKHIILRTAWVFSEKGNNFIKTMLRICQNSTELKIVGDQFGGPTYAVDIASSLIKIAKCIVQGKIIKYGIYHYSGLPHLSWYEFANTIFDTALAQGYISDKPKITSITTEQYPTLAKRPKNSRLNTEKIKKEFSIEPSDWKVALTNIHGYEA